MAKKDNIAPKKQPRGDYPVGYARTPEHTRIQEREVRNPWGRNGKPRIDGPDPFEFAMGQETTITIDGVKMSVTAEAAMFLKQTAAAMRGDVSPFKVLVEERRTRRGTAPPPPTAAQQEKAAAELQKRKELSARLVQSLEDAACRKKRGKPLFSVLSPDDDQVSGDGG